MTMLHDPQVPTTEDAALARQSCQKLAALNVKNASAQVQITSPDNHIENVRLPVSALPLIQEILAELGTGNAVALTSIHPMLTTQEAADLMGVSRPFIIKEIEASRIPCTTVGTHRRISLADLLAYKARCRAIHDEVMNELAAETQEFEADN